MPAAIERWIICIVGYRQEGKPSGIEKIQDSLHRQCGGADTRVLLKSWRDNMVDLASRMWNRRPIDHQPRITIIGYSYGGLTAVKLVRELEKTKWEAEILLLIDPVWRFWDAMPSPSSLFSGWQIQLGDNVGTLWWWHQAVDRPRGHRVNCDENKILVHEKTMLLPHHEIDDSPEIFDIAMHISCPEKNTV